MGAFGAGLGGLDSSSIAACYGPSLPGRPADEGDGRAVDPNVPASEGAISRPATGVEDGHLAPPRMPPMSGVSSAPRVPAFFLAEDASLEAPRLREEDEEHAVRVLRLAVDDGLDGLDGRGRRVPLRVARVVRGRLVLEVTGAVEEAPEPGQEGSSLPWFELAVSWPRKNRVEDMVGRLVQLGVAALRPLECRHRGPEEPLRAATERLKRVVREACKQSGRWWLPVLEASLTPARLAEVRSTCPLAVLDPHAGLSLDVWLRSLRPSPLGIGTRTRPIVLVIGPEGGLAEEELLALESRGGSPVWVGPHILRVETAAEAAMAVAGALHGHRASSPQQRTPRS